MNPPTKGPAKVRLRGFLESPRLPLWLALIGVGLVLPSLWSGIAGDDWFHRAHLLGIELLPGVVADPIFGLFTFYDGTPEGNRLLIDSGFIPWWGGDTILASFFRPLTGLSHVVDYALWPDNFVLQHAHSLLIWGVALVGVGLMFRRLCASALTAGLAGLLFAVDDAHAMPAGWLANRNSLLTLAFGVAALNLHVAWRRGGAHRTLALALLCGALGLAAGEATLGAFAYIAAWQLCADRGDLRRRVLGLVPWLLLGATWAVVYTAGGYGARQSGLYIDPGGEPLRFAIGLMERWPLLLAGQWLQAPVDGWMFLTRGQQIASAVVAGAAAVGLVALFSRWLRRSAEARFWALGMALSMVPLCGAFPMDRLLIFAGLGAFALLAQAAVDLGLLGASGSAPFTSPWRRRIVLALLVLHGPVAGLLLPARVATLPLFASFFALGADGAPTDAALSEQTLVFVTGNEFPIAYTAVIRRVEGIRPVPRRVALLASVAGDNLVTRLDEDTLRIEPEDGFLAASFDRLARHPSNRFALNERIERPDYSVLVDSLTEDGRPAVVRIRFREPLESPSYRWIFFDDGRLVPWPPLAVGEQRTVRGTLFRP